MRARAGSNHGDAGNPGPIGLVPVQPRQPPYLVVALAPLLLSGLAVVATHSMAAAGGGEIGLEDPVGDVALLDPTAPGVPSKEVGAGLDLKSARLYGENGREFLFDIVLDGFRPQYVPAHLFVAVCFEWNGQGYASTSSYRGVAPGPQFLTVLDGPCAKGSPVTPVPGKSISNGANVTFDEDANKITVSVTKAGLASLAGAAPRAGDSVGKLWVLSWDRTIAGPASRYDALPDAGPDGAVMALAHEASGRSTLTARAASNAGGFVCGARADAPFHAFEAGGKRGVPVIFRNTGDVARTVAFTVETMDGQDWSPRIVPELVLAPASEVGNVTVTIILDTPPTTKHKDCAILRVRGTDTSDPTNLAEVMVGAIAVQQPNVETNRLHLHGTLRALDTCGGRYTWLNVLEEDPADEHPSITMRYCQDRRPSILSTTKVGFLAGLDVYPPRDLIVNTSASDKAASMTLVVQSSMPDTRGRLFVDVITRPRTGDGETFAEGYVDALIPEGETAIEVPLRIGFTRDEVAGGDPSRVLAAADGFGVVVSYQAAAKDSTVPEAAVAGGDVSLSTDGTYLELPIWAAIQRNVAEPGASGALLSLKPVGDLPSFAYPGAARLLNLSVLNEGPEHEVAVFESTLTGPRGWSATILPGATLQLAPGERKLVQVAIVPPASANESESVLVEVNVHSQKDPTARSSLATRVTASREGGVGQDLIPTDGPGRAGGIVPAPAGLDLLVLLAGLAALARSRRRGQV